MSRSGYTEDIENWTLIRWRGAVTSAIRGKRGQAFFKEALAALDALPEKKLVSEDLISKDGAVCMLGAVGLARGIDMKGIDPEDHETVAAAFNIPHALACEIMFTNDDMWSYTRAETPEKRWERMRKYIVACIKEEA